MKKVNLLLLFLLGFVSQNVNAQCINGNCINGQGTWKWESGSIYTGEFKNSTRNGYGQYRFKNGAIHIGEWQNNERHGYGVYYYNARSKYKVYAGEWKESERSGIGIIEFKNDVPAKFGVWKGNQFLYVYKDTGCIDGDCYTGQGTYVWEDGSRYEEVLYHKKTLRTYLQVF